MARDGGVTCWPCHERLALLLAEIVVRYHKLDPSPGSSGMTERRAPGFRSTPPLNLHVVALRDPRTRVVEPGDPCCALRTYRTWANHIRRERRQRTRRRGIVREGQYLTDSLDWVTRQHWVLDFAAEIERVCSQLRAANGEPNPKPVSWCIAVLGDGSVCNHPLFPPRKHTELIVCAGCTAEYDYLAQIRARLEAESVDPSAFHCACGHADTQHDNDSIGRPCNVRWCDCTAYGIEQQENAA